MKVVLASQSPRRRELLEQIAVQHEVFIADVDESPLPNELPRDYVQRTARLKAEAAVKANPDRVVLAADTAVVCDQRIMGKPADEQDARDMLRLLSGRSHEVYCAVWVQQATESHSAVNVSQVTFRVITDDEITTYWHTGEPQDKAGAYAIQGRAAVFIKRLEGSFSAVMGLPLFETAQCLAPFDEVTE